MSIIKKNISLKDKTTYRIGGYAAFYACIHSDEDIHDVLVWAKENKQPVFILGNGSNILVSDYGWPGLVIDMSEYSSIIYDGLSVTSRSGTLLHNLVKDTVEKGILGFEELAGIPGSIGGALIMNAGAFEQTISDCLFSVSGIDRSECNTWELHRNEIDFGYRTSSLKKMNSIMLNAIFSFNKIDKEKSLSTYQEILKKRNEKQPVNIPSCGSVFKRPKGNYAGALIEKCGLKGYSIRGAKISEKHANFIVNKSDASASDVRQLIVIIQERVFKEFGILLEPEVVFVGEFDIPLFKP